MTVLTDIIEINISRETAAVAQTNFNVPLFISAHTKFAIRASKGKPYIFSSSIGNFPFTSLCYPDESISI